MRGIFSGNLLDFLVLSSMNRRRWCWPDLIRRRQLLFDWHGSAKWPTEINDNNEWFTNWLIRHDLIYLLTFLTSWNMCTMWGPLVISWFITPSDYSYNYDKPWWNCSYLHQLSDSVGAPHCKIWWCSASQAVPVPWLSAASSATRADTIFGTKKR